ncbi:MAG: hypothetical protein HYU67_03825 [Flavobacteriia bacterium]|nr:hypothetical protein [Flavobacteriia bacterium]
MVLGKKILFIGFGEVGSLSASLFNSFFTNCHFFIYDIHPSIEGKILDFSHACVMNSNQCTRLNQLSLLDMDYIVYTAGFSNQYGMPRSSVEKENKELIKTLFNDLKLDSKSYLITVTNPVDKVTKCLIDVLKAPSQIIGTGTSLDTFRLKYILSYKLNVNPNDITTYVIGEHGQGMIPLWSKTFINGKSVYDYFNETQLNELKEELIQSASQIRKTEKATKFGIAENIVQIVKALQNNEKTVLCLSIEITESSIELRKRATCVVLSYPCEVHSNQIKISTDFDLNEEEVKQLNKCIEEMYLA